MARTLMANELEQDVADKCLAVNSQKVTNCSLLAHPKKLRENENSRILKTNSPYFTNLATGFFWQNLKIFPCLVSQTISSTIVC